ncbi:MAG: heterodisulfide reductase-related iron-sulfur binding cluster, partial [Desulfovermiculus sp.]|nr:heterodisulfide reductase-related iron-sulfur binding cluster [Desulfovermiculus sp.]
MTTDLDNTPEQIMRKVLTGCADCDTCRFLMDESCLFFPELYRLFDREMEEERLVSDAELYELAQLCTLCDLCPCPNVRADIMKAKTEFVHRDGLPLRQRLLADVQKFGKMTSNMPALIKRSLELPGMKGMLKKAAGIHPSRRMTSLPRESFFRWADKKGLGEADPGHEPKVAYFAGCTAGFLFPQVAKAAVAVLEHNNIKVHVPPQQCCGMPTLLEGEKNSTLQRAGLNLESLLGKIDEGYDLVCSCPTCGYLMKSLLREGAVYSRAYQEAVGAGKDEIKVPKERESGFARLSKAMYGQLLKDDGYFSGLDPLGRIALSSQVQDIGQYLLGLSEQGVLNLPSGEVKTRMVYFAPCHQREQKMGSPYAGLLSKVPGLTIEQVGGSLDCCGMGGSLGMKESFYQASIKLGQPLLNKIQAAAPEAIVTDCLSCRIQFEHL